MKQIKLSCGSICLIDNENFEEISKHKWRLVGAGYVSRGTKNYKTNTQHTIYLHRFLTNAHPDEEVDHINGNKLDNRKENLRICQHGENCQKRPKAKRTKHKLSSKYKGVSFHKKLKKYRARIYAEGTDHYLGNFKLEVDAALAYNKAALFFFKEYAELNIIKD